MTGRMITWMSLISILLVVWGFIFAFFGLGILPVVDRTVLLPWESAIYGAVLIGWGTTLLLIGRVALQKNDKILMKNLLYGIVLWLAVEALFSLYFGVWFNVGVDFAVMFLFAVPLIQGIRSTTNDQDTISNTET